ncbi:MAG: hypothetical protein CL581_09900 [Alteromonadaceae bacterium]|nr:hypothetical protein [Alteromonadaceae bacterium]MBH84936.1 hypothetical protein [Alteromonadaceae bacterium]|tara:strand:+ start:15990 stop:16607 length:618 start_codon:yes stop_codon:yes gene_type:complete
MPHSGQNDGVATLNRRNFLRLGLGSATLLAGASLTANLSGCSSSDAPAAENTASGYRYQFLTADDLTLFRALLPAIVGPSLPPEQSPQQSAIEGTIQNIDSGIVHFSRANQQQLRQLLDLLNGSFTRITLARMWPTWEEASTDDVSRFLARWRDSSIGLFNNGYIALIKITNVAFYGNPAHWEVSRYPGPPKWAVDALPQFQSPA